MSFMKFVMWFIGGLMLIAAVDTFLKNTFITAFIAATIMGVLGAKDD